MGSYSELIQVAVKWSELPIWLFPQKSDRVHAAAAERQMVFF